MNVGRGTSRGALARMNLGIVNVFILAVGFVFAIGYAALFFAGVR